MYMKGHKMIFFYSYLEKIISIHLTQFRHLAVLLDQLIDNKGDDVY